MTEHLNLVRAGEVGGLPVVTIDGGEDAAEIRDVVYDAERHHLIGFTLNKRGWFRGTLGATLYVDDVVGIGPAAVMVPNEGSLAERDKGSQLGGGGETQDVIGDTVVSSGGTEIGTVVDVVIETGTNPKAVGYEVETDNGNVFIPSSAQMAVSGDNLIVPAEAEEFTANDLAGFGASVTSFRQKLGAEEGSAS